MKEYLKIYLGGNSNPEKAFLDIYDKLSKICKDIGWDIKQTPKALENIIQPRNWYPEFCINFDKDNKTIFVGTNKKPGFIMYNTCLLDSFEDGYVDHNISMFKKYMLFNGNSSDYSSQLITSKDDYISGHIERFKSDRHINGITRYHLPQLLNKMVSRPINDHTPEASKLSALFDLNEDKNVISTNPKNGADVTMVNIITDGMFKEIFGAKSGDFLKASNSLLPDISMKDRRQSDWAHNTGAPTQTQYLHINGKIICNGEFLQMADVGSDQLNKLLRNVDDSSSYTTLVKYDYGENERNISFLIRSNDYDGDLLGELYIINVERNDDPYYKPSFNKYELFLTEENELKLIKK